MSQSWATEQELSFLKNLGTYREGDERRPRRLQLLEKYVKAARERSDWGPVNRETVMRFTEEMLAEAHLQTGQASC